ncbi:hypothetical protein [Cupriavidus alkaliphilus]|uniref:hypothetical protein n=1 Tax=Cupriavidus alkaliphilus TaxID=942866 RepID=UPI00339DA71C
MSRIAAIFLMLLLPLQAFAAVERQLAHTAGALMDHMVVHAEHVPHHHDDDGDIQADDSASSASHQLDFDHGSNFQGILMMPLLAPVLPQAQPAPGFHSSTVPDPTGRPPLRPPHAPA